MKLRILYLADPNLIHDLNWMRFFARQVDKFELLMLSRRVHAERYGLERLQGWAKAENIAFMGVLDDFSLRHAWRTWRQGRWLRSLIERERIDIFHIFYAEPNALWLNFRLPARCILTTRGSDVLQTIPAFSQRGGLLAALVSRLYRRAFLRFDAITCTSEAQRAKTQEICGGAFSRPLLLVRTGIDLAALDASATAELPPAIAQLPKPFLLLPRNMRPVYNHELALQALALLPANLRERFAIVLVHSDSPEYDYVRSIQNLLNAQDMQYVFLPLVPPATLFALYRAAALVLMTPKSDGTPVSALEAMYLQAPLILPPLPYDEDVFPSESVRRLQDWQPQTLAAALVDILQNKQMPNTQLAADTVRQKADRSKEMQKLQNLYETGANQHLPTDKE